MPNEVMLTARVPQSLLDGLDRLMERKRKAEPGRNLTRADLVRMLLFQAIALDEMSRSALADPDPRGGKGRRR